MPSICGVLGCSNKQTKVPGKSFFRLPTVDSRYGGINEGMTRKRRDLWLANLSRTDLTETGKRHLIVCSDHFLSGYPAPLRATTDPDWAPTQKLGHKKVSQASVATWHQRRQEKNDKEMIMAAHDSTPSSVMCDRSYSAYANCLPEDQRSEYYAKLQLEDPRIDFPDPYRLAKWTNDMKKWPDLSSIHVHRYLLSRQEPMIESEETECASLQGYNAFKLGNVQEVQYATVSKISQVCFLKAIVVLHPKAGTDACQAWVCLEKETGSIKASHCICLRDFAEVCGHIAGLLFKVEAGVALAKNKEESPRVISNTSNGAFNKSARSRLCFARVKDTFFTHQHSNKGLRQPLKDLKLKPLSRVEENEALARLKEIVPNAAVFAKDDSDTDSATGSEGDGEKFSSSQYYLHTAPADVVDSVTGSEGDREKFSPSQYYSHTAPADVVDSVTGSEGDREKFSPSQYYPHTAPADVVEQQPSPLLDIHSQTTLDDPPDDADDDTLSVVSAYDFEGFPCDFEGFETTEAEGSVTAATLQQ